MGVFKEEVSYLEDLAKLQQQIYPDSCDYGVYATQERKDRIHEILLSLPAGPDGRPAGKPVWKSDVGGMTQRTYNSEVMWDNSDGVNIAITYVRDRPRKKEYFAIDLKPIHLGEEYNDDY